MTSESDHDMSVVSTGDIEGIGIVVGHGSSASVNMSQSAMDADLAAELGKFILLLDRYGAEMADALAVRESAVEVQSELGKPSPRWAIVRTLIAGIKASVINVATLTEAINNIQILVGHGAK
jgi:hypothetical protein